MRAIKTWVSVGAMAAVLLVLVLLVGCGRGTTADGPDAAAQQAWSTIVTGHTTGVVSRRSAVNVLFSSDVLDASPDAVKADAAAIFSIEPTVAGKAGFSGSRALVFTPSGELKPGQQYIVRIAPKGLKGVPQELAPYEFRFSAQTPQFDVALQGLESDPGDDRRMILRGTLNAADTEDPAKIEALVTANFLGKPVALQWAHDSDGLTHRFAALGLERQSKAETVAVKWSGQPIGSGATGEQTIDVPARGSFLVTEAEAIDADGRRQILVSFSDALGERQNLRGLVRLAPEVAFTTQIENNLLTVYPEGDLQGEVTVTLESGIRNARGEPLGEQVARTLTFTSTKPQVRFVGKGVILPDSKILSVPFEAVSVRSVRVVATRIYDDNISQFLQVNALDGNDEIGRVGRFLWRKTIPLTGPNTGRWQRYSLDVTELTQKFPGGMFQLELQITPRDSTYRCDDAAASSPAETEPLLQSQEDGDQSQSSNWDFSEQYYGESGGDWNRRGDPCAGAYYRWGENITSKRNLLASNIGLLAKRDQYGKLLVAATNLRTAAAMPGTKFSVRNYQNQEVGLGTSDANGVATISPTGTPFLLIAEANDQRGFLKLGAGAALPVSHFDVGGESVTKGLKGYIYGERGIWRPGDTLHLTFVLQDKGATLPADHPATMEFYDPRGQLVQTVANTSPVGGFYRFEMRTGESAPTGDWTAKVLLGGTSFSKRVKIETIMPNRLKVALDLGPNGLAAGSTIEGKVAAQWLSGGTAAGLRSDVKLRLTPAPTSFTSHTDFVFDDPAREFSAEPETLFEGELDSGGNAKFSKTLQLASAPPGRLTAAFTTRVFEKGGAFSINSDSAPYSPFERYVGLRLPKGDVARDMLMTDKDHVVQIASLTADGKAVAISKLQVTLYKVEWKWWWDKNGESLAQYVQGESNAVIRSETIATVSGKGQWSFNVKYPEWGRYLIRVCDIDGGHCAGRTFYIDWPSWAGKEREQSGVAASVLTVTSDKPEYKVGETATIQLPETAQGRALLTVENGSGILESRWIEPRPKNTRFTVQITEKMTPNVYVAVTLVQPHENKGNDRPLRLYGVIPLKVTDPATRLTPVLKAADEWKPESKVQVEVSEASGRAMTYTVAVVDEGLLGLTNFKTPDLYGEFYKREALGVLTWDLYDHVAGAYSAQLERLLALGGSDAAAANRPDQSKSRFPPVVRYLGPFKLKARASAKHTIELPPYVGAVRVMVVAGEAAAYGSAEKSVFVRQPLMLLPTMPRVIGPGEEVGVPVSLFVTRAGIRNVTLTIEPDAFFEVLGERSVQVSFTQPDEKLGMLKLRTANRLGEGRVKFVATSGSHRAEGEIYVDIRSSNPPTTRHQSHVLQPGETWNTTLKPHGIAGTNVSTLEVSGLPPLNLEARLRFLIQYPHGCLEQTTSAAFPQLYLGALLKLEDSRKREIENNIRGAIERLRYFQRANGSFSYWAGGSGGFDAPGASDEYSRWATTYAGHFLVEAERAGYTLPASMKSGLVRSLRSSAASWKHTPNAGSARDPARQAVLDQSYRLYVLALAGSPDVGAMNRLRQSAALADTDRWLLAASYKLAGLADVASALTRNASLRVSEYTASDYTFGGALRDRALLLQSLVTLGRLDKTADLVRAISAELSSEGWYSTQSVSFSLLAMAKFSGSGTPTAFGFERRIGDEKPMAVTSRTPLHQEEIKAALLRSTGTAVQLRNTSQRVLFVTLATRGVPAAGADSASSSGLGMDIAYTDDGGQPRDVTKLVQGTDLIANITVKNLTALRIDNIALTQMVPAGWEIHNERLENVDPTGTRDPGDARRSPFAPPANVLPDHVDIRDDRVLQYFGLKSGETIRFKTRLNAAYLGRYYLPSVSAEAMYDATQNARSQGQWVQVVTRAP